ncbi:hypothetical protein Taro_001121, partial [Colocasia esculenta]|nr:hypothetical protein [Colocasia esculenta]
MNQFAYIKITKRKKLAQMPLMIMLLSGRWSLMRRKSGPMMRTKRTKRMN